LQQKQEAAQKEEIVLFTGLINTNSSNTISPIAAVSPIAAAIHDCSPYIRKQVGNSEILHGLQLNNEYEVIPFNHFTFSRVYPIDLGLGKRVVEKPIGYKRKDLLEVLSKAIETLNKNVTITTNKYTLDDFTEGIYRNEPTTGTQYDLYFRTKEANKNSTHHEHNMNNYNHGITKVVLMRPFAPLQTIQMQLFPKMHDKELIHIILPLSGRISTFQSFMDKFVKIALKHDKKVHLTVIYFGEDGLSDARKIMSRVISMKNTGGSAANLKLLALNETFSRGIL
jgi:chondroitin sulfate N-acetylgalactosaminyltransferase 1/2